MQQLRAIFIHGNGGGTARDHWFPSVQEALEAMNIQVTAKDFPDADLAREKYWIPFLEKECLADEHSILIGHSSGAVAAMRFAERHKIFGSILVSACYTDTGDEKERLSGYYDRPWDWDAIKENQQWIIQFASSDDPFIAIEEARYIHERLGTEYYEYTDRGHFITQEFPELIKVLRTKFSNKGS